MSTLTSIIQGKLLSQTQALRELEGLPKPGRGRNPPPPPPPPATANVQNDRYQIDKGYVLAHTTPTYRRFLRESGYADIDTSSGLAVAKGVLKIDSTVRQAATNIGLGITGNDGDYIVNINHSNARKLVQALGYQVLPVGLMYGVFIPYIKELATGGNPDAQATLNEMTNTKAEWLEDIVKDKQDIHIGTKHHPLNLPREDGRFDHADRNDFGYPTQIKPAGEFYYWYPRGEEQAAVRDWDSGLGLVLDGGPSIEDGGLGVRLAKILP